MAYDVFISHSSKDKAMADAVTASLENAKIRCWIAPRDIRAGDSWGGAIVEAIESCQVMVLIFSAKSNASKQVMREVERAVQHDVVVVPYRIEDVTPTRDMEYFLSSTHWLDAVSPELEDHLDELKTTVLSILDKPTPTSRPTSLDTPVSASNQASTPVQPSGKPEPKTEADLSKPSKLPILLTGLALTFVLGFLSYAFIAGDTDDEQEIRANASQGQQAIRPKGEGDIKLIAPESVLAGSAVEVSWKGPVTEKDYIVIAAHDAADHIKTDRKVVGSATSVKLTAAPKPGDYQIRFFDSVNNEIIDRKPLSIAAPKVTLDAPAKGQVGQSIAIAWVGPNQRRDYLAIAKSGSKGNSYINYSYTANGSPTNLRLPDAGGEYELRYVSGSGKIVWQTSKILVEEADVSIEELNPQIAGSEVSVKWSGPANKGDYLTIAKPSDAPKTYSSYRYVKAGSTTKLRMPSQAGNYQIRYISGQQKLIWASTEVEVQMPEVSIEPPSSAIVGTLLKLNWQGPANRGDYITIAEPGSAGSKYLTYRYVKAQSLVELKAPQLSGDYVVRYISGEDKSVWYEAPLTVAPRSETLEVAGSVVVGKSFKVSWQEVGQKGEYVAIYPTGAADSERYLNQASSANKTSTNLKAPKQAGDYEVRYMSGDKKQVWARQQLLIEEP